MSFWREHMPAGMMLRSASSWHFDPTQVHTLEAFLAERGIAPADVDPVPIELFLEYAEWFVRSKRLTVHERMVTRLAKPNGRFEATLDDGSVIAADTVVATPGIARFQQFPPWAERLAPGRAAHTLDFVKFDELAGARVLIVGGRQSAYEWAALIGERGAERIDIVHRHEAPRFERIDWGFADALLENTVKRRGWWRGLTQAEREAIARRFWEAGRLTLEWWLVPRLARAGIHRWPSTEVAAVENDGERGAARVRLSNGERLDVDRVVFATGFRADLPKVPYLADLLDRIEVAEGSPVLGESFESSVAGLYLTGFVAFRDFGPIFGFVRATPASAQIIVADLLNR
jgi:cation diffusion facilitator CzcD-associated flavoprotein CzcO